MTTTTTAHLPAVPEHYRQEAGQGLQDTLLELLDLSLLGKQLHWSVTGPLFRPLHLYLDELVDSWRELADTAAERAVAIGHWPDGQAGTVAAGAASPVDVGPVSDGAVVRQLTQHLAATAERARGRMERLADIDAASQDVLMETVRALEEQLWMLRTQLA